MAFKLIIFCTVLSLANAIFVSPASYAAAHEVKYINPAVASTQQNVVRSFGGTVSSYSKLVDTPYSSVRKVNTRINNNAYAPVVANTLTFADPAITKTIETPTFYAHTAPTVTKSLAYAFPEITQTIAAPTGYIHAVPTVTKTVYSHEAPAVNAQSAIAKTVAYATPTAATSYNHGPAATTYSHSAPGVSGYGTSQTVQYSPAEMVSHMSFDGFGTHWGF